MSRMLREGIAAGVLGALAVALCWIAYTGGF